MEENFQKSRLFSFYLTDLLNSIFQLPEKNYIKNTCRNSDYPYVTSLSRYFCNKGTVLSHSQDIYDQYVPCFICLFSFCNIHFLFSFPFIACCLRTSKGKLRAICSGICLALALCTHLQPFLTKLCNESASDVRLRRFVYNMKVFCNTSVKMRNMRLSY